MRQAQEGSILLLVMFTAAMLALLLPLAIQQVHYQHQTVLDRLAYERDLSTIESVLSYGILWYAMHWDTLMHDENKDASWRLSLGNLSPENDHPRIAFVQMNSRDGHAAFEASIHKADGTKSTATCTISRKDSDTFFTVSHWQVMV